MGVAGHEAEVHDVSEESQERQRAAFGSILERARALAQRAEDLDDFAAVTLSTLEHTAASLVAELDSRLVEFVVSPMGDGPGLLLQVAAVTTPADPAAALDHLVRCRRLDTYLDGCTARLRAGAEGGRTPVRALVQRTLGMIEGYLASDPVEDALVTVPAPAGWDGEPAWRAQLAVVVAEQVRPAVERYRDLLVSLVPRS